MQGGGHDRKWYEPLASDGTRDLDIAEETLGCHVGPHAGLNVARPQPGYEYCWAINDPRELLRIRMRGGQVVQGEDPEYSVYSDFDDPDRTPIDTANLYREVVLVRTPIEKVRERREEERQRAEKSITGGLEDFINKASAQEAAVGTPDNPTRFARREHMVEFEADGRTEAFWTPGSGIVRR